MSDDARAGGDDLLLIVAARLFLEDAPMTMANGMKILGPAFEPAPKPKARDTRNVAEMMRQRALDEKARARARLQMFRKVVSSTGKA
jgi:hypothetical protein